MFQTAVAQTGRVTVVFSEVITCYVRIRAFSVLRRTSKWCYALDCSPGIARVRRFGSQARRGVRGLETARQPGLLAPLLRQRAAGTGHADRLRILLMPRTGRTEAHLNAGRW